MVLVLQDWNEVSGFIIVGTLAQEYGMVGADWGG